MSASQETYEKFGDSTAPKVVASETERNGRLSPDHHTVIDSESLYLMGEGEIFSGCSTVQASSNLA